MSRGGRSFMEKLEATAASPLDSKIIKATDSSVDVPKAKHMEALLLFTHLPDYNQGKIVESLLWRTREPSWVTVLKSLIIMHRLIRDGHERFSQFLATSSVGINLQDFLDGTSPEALSMTGFIRAYASYLTAKIGLYRTLGFDICHVKAGEHMERLPNSTLADIGKNLKNYMELCHSLISCVTSDPESAVQAVGGGRGHFSVQVKIPPADLFGNNCIKGAVRLLLKDCLRIFVCMNECVVKMLEIFFKLPKKEATDSLALYSEFVGISAQLNDFFAKAKEAGVMDGRHIPDLTSAPKVLMPAMKDYVDNYGAWKQSDAEADAMSGQMARVKLASSEAMGEDTHTEC